MYKDELVKYYDSIAPSDEQRARMLKNIKAAPEKKALNIKNISAITASAAACAAIVFAVSNYRITDNTRDFTPVIPTPAPTQSRDVHGFAIEEGEDILPEITSTPVPTTKAVSTDAPRATQKAVNAPVKTSSPEVKYQIKSTTVPVQENTSAEIREQKNEKSNSVEFDENAITVTEVPVNDMVQADNEIAVADETVPEAAIAAQTVSDEMYVEMNINRIETARSSGGGSGGSSSAASYKAEKVGIDEFEESVGIKYSENLSVPSDLQNNTPYEMSGIANSWNYIYTSQDGERRISAMVSKLNIENINPENLKISKFGDCEVLIKEENGVYSAVFNKNSVSVRISARGITEVELKDFIISAVVG